MMDLLSSKYKDILLYLFNHNGKNQREIQQSVGGSFSTIKKYIDILESQGLINKRIEVNRDDKGNQVVGHQNVFFITDKGKNIVQKLLAINKLKDEIKEIMEKEE